jgi:hypothetical protein
MRIDASPMQHSRSLPHSSLVTQLHPCLQTCFSATSQNPNRLIEPLREGYSVRLALIER